MVQQIFQYRYCQNWKKKVTRLDNNHYLLKLEITTYLLRIFLENYLLSFRFTTVATIILHRTSTFFHGFFSDQIGKLFRRGSTATRWTRRWFRTRSAFSFLTSCFSYRSERLIGWTGTRLLLFSSCFRWAWTLFSENE